MGTEWTSACGPEDKNDGFSVPAELAGSLYCPLLHYSKPSITSARIWFAIRTMRSFYRKSWFLSTNPGFCTVLLIEGTCKVSKYQPRFTDVYFGVWGSKTICSVKLVGEPVLVKQQNSERVGNSDQITPDPASCPLDRMRPSQKKCRDQEAPPKSAEKRTWNLLLASMKWLHYAIRFLPPLSLLVKDRFMSRSIMVQKSLTPLHEDVGNLWWY